MLSGLVVLLWPGAALGVGVVKELYVAGEANADVDEPAAVVVEGWWARLLGRPAWGAPFELKGGLNIVCGGSPSFPLPFIRLDIVGPLFVVDRCDDLMRGEMKVVELGGA